MHATAGADHFEVINGPEDGSEFVITRTPFEIGSDPGCTVCSRFDSQMKMYHARVTAVSKGYSIRSLAGGGVWVNGKRAGRIRSRVLRAKDHLRVGSTEFVVHLAEGGLASRSYGMRMESDFVYALKGLGKALMAPMSLLAWLLSSGKIRLLAVVLALLGIASIASPAFGAEVASWIRWGWDWTVYWFYQAYFYLKMQAGPGA